jgi:FKBP-type peptidyl-prolyl cis-trans isomerase
MRTFGIREWIAVAVALVAAAILFFGGNIWNFFFGNSVSSSSTISATAPLTNNPTNATTTSGSVTSTTMQNISTTKGIEIYDEQVGTGAEAVAGKTVSAHYIGTLTDGTKFDSSVDRGQPFEFPLGAGRVIKGWDIGIAGMKVGGVRRLVISPELAYGAQAIGPIPANSTLIFEVQLVAVK